MKRIYLRAGDQFEWWDRVDATAKTTVIIEREYAPIFTGLLDASGNKIFAQNQHDPVGFVHFKCRDEP